MANDPYKTLGVAKGATKAEVKSAYRKLAKKFHPDRNKDNPKASERFSEATNAYDLLSDKEKRGQFDRGEIDADGNPTSPFGMGGGGGYRGSGGMGAGGQAGRGYSAQDFAGAEDLDLGSLFEGMFGRGGGGAGAQASAGRRRPPPLQRGADVSYRLAVAFVDAASRADQRITLSDGKSINLKLPAGVTDGTQMRLKGKGQTGPGGTGDALITININPHAFFKRDDDDVRMTMPITLDEAVNGAKMKVPTVDGVVMLTVAAGTSSDAVLRLKGKGFSRKKGGRGDQLVSMEIQLPDDLTELSKRLDGWKDATNLREDLNV